MERDLLMSRAICEIRQVEGSPDHICALCGRRWTNPVLPVRAHCRVAAVGSRRQLPEAVAVSQDGPGSKLKKLIGLFGFTTKSCSRCGRRAAEMDRQGASWCRQNLETIVGWLREEAARRRIPFSDRLARKLILTAIRQAERHLGDKKPR
jgi:hypothetical protein